MAEELAPLLIIVGETASGKSALALEVAQKLNGEIICADSWTVYKGFDIGTAKPTAVEQKLVRHHLLDVTTADKGFSAAQFQRLALAAINDIARKGKLVIMVGGSGLYIDSVIFNYSFLPTPSASQRAVLNELTLTELLAIASDRGLPLGSVDTKNKRRVIRLIENNGGSPSKSALRPNTLVVGLAPERSQLEARIEKRIDGMVRAGLVDEVAHLGAIYGWECQPMKAPGYRAFAGYVHGTTTLEAAKHEFKINDLKLAKKQRTWFRRPIYNNSIQWVTNRGELSKNVDLLTTLLNKKS